MCSYVSFLLYIFLNRTKIHYSYNLQYYKFTGIPGVGYKKYGYNNYIYYKYYPSELHRITYGKKITIAQANAGYNKSLTRCRYPCELHSNAYREKRQKNREEISPLPLRFTSRGVPAILLWLSRPFRVWPSGPPPGRPEPFRQFR